MTLRYVFISTFFVFIWSLSLCVCVCVCVCIAMFVFQMGVASFNQLNLWLVVLSTLLWYEDLTEITI